jgi:hypothetical protein
MHVAKCFCAKIFQAKIFLDAAQIIHNIAKDFTFQEFDGNTEYLV